MHLLQLLFPRIFVTLFCCSLSFLNQDDGDGDSDVESKDLDLPLRDPVHLRTDKKFDDAYISQKELGKYVSLFLVILSYFLKHGCHLVEESWSSGLGCWTSSQEVPSLNPPPYCELFVPGPCSVNS